MGRLAMKENPFETLEHVSTQLHALSDQFVHQKDNTFAQMASCVDDVRDTIRHLDQTLTVPAAEYVSAIADAFPLLDKLTGNPRPDNTQTP